MSFAVASYFSNTITILCFLVFPNPNNASIVILCVLCFLISSFFLFLLPPVCNRGMS